MKQLMRIIAMLLVLLMTVSVFAACGDNKDDKDDPKETERETERETEAQTEHDLTNQEIENLKNEMEQNGDLPNSVRKVLQSKSLTGIHNTIGNVLATEDKYVKALNTAIASCKNFVITKDEESAKKAITLFFCVPAKPPSGTISTLSMMSSPAVVNVP